MNKMIQKRFQVKNTEMQIHIGCNELNYFFATFIQKCKIWW